MDGGQEIADRPSALLGWPHGQLIDALGCEPHGQQRAIRAGYRCTAEVGEGARTAFLESTGHARREDTISFFLVHSPTGK